MDGTCIALLCTFLLPQSALQNLLLMHWLTHQWAAVAMQGAGRPIGSHVGFSVLPMDTLRCGQLELGFEHRSFIFGQLALLTVPQLPFK